MPSIINSDDGVVSGTSGLKTTGGNDGLLNIQTNGSTAMSVNASQQVTFNNGANLPNTFGFKNRIINGAMVIDQRNAGAAVTQTTSVVYTVDRWSCYGSVASKFTVQRSTTAPAGFTNSLLVTSSSAYTVGASEFFFIQQVIEGFNVADLGWGTVNAQTVTLSFQVRSSLTGTFGGTISNASTNRVYPFTFTISAANTSETKTITIAGDTTGTWSTDNNGGIVVNFNMGAGASVSGTAGAWSGSTLRAPTGATSVVGTNGATFYITGVQLERGSIATSFDFRDYGRELIMCQRYFEKSYDQGTTPGTVSSLGMFTSIRGNGIAGTSMTFKVTKRAAPTMTAYAPSSGTAGNGRDYNAGADRAVTFDSIGDSAFTISMGGASVSSAFGVQWVASIEL
jgi:hypothetical protein